MAVISYRSQAAAGHDGFGQLLRAEWVKFRTVRGWVIGMIVAALATVGFGLAVSSGAYCSVGPFPGQPVALACAAPIGPGGEAVSDEFYFVHRPLAGDGSLTARVTSLTGGQGSGPQPWSKGGIIIKQSLRPGSAYAAMMVTGGHGVRMQYDYTGDTPGLPGVVSAAAPRWLRLTRAGNTVTGYDSADGVHWARVGAVRLPGLPTVVQAGLFATSPAPVSVSRGLASQSAVHGPGQAVATFDQVSPGRTWTGTEIALQPHPGDTALSGYQQAGGTFTVSGAGDIAPGVSGQSVGMPIAHTLVGAFAGLIAATVVASMFVTAEYRRGLIRLTLAASPRRSRVLAAKAVVIGAVSFVTGLVGAAVAVPLGEGVLRGHGNFIEPVTALTELRVVAGTAALLAVAAVLALAVGTVLRSSAGAVTAVIVGIVLPYLLAVASPALPAAAADWLLRLTPAAAFAVQATGQRYPQVDDSYLPFFGYYPLSPWGGLAVLCGYAAAALILATFLLRRRDT